MAWAFIHTNSRVAVAPVTSTRRPAVAAAAGSEGSAGVMGSVVNGDGGRRSGACEKLQRPR